MTIIEAIHSAPSEHAVFFLLSAYVESLRHFERGAGVPAAALRLPIAGLADLGERLEVLQQRADSSLEPMYPWPKRARSSIVLSHALARSARPPGKSYALRENR